MNRIRDIIADYWLGAATLAFGMLCVYLVIKSGA